MDIVFTALSWLTAAMCIFHGFMFWRGGKVFARSPRWRWPALVIGVPCLVWCAWHGCLMLEGPLASLHPVVWLLVPVLAVMSWFFIDYLFCRVCGGFFILAVNELLRRGFGNEVCLRPLFALCCLLLGVAGLFMIGIPWRIRELLETWAGRRKGRIAALVLLFCALVLMVLPLI